MFQNLIRELHLSKWKTFLRMVSFLLATVLFYAIKLDIFGEAMLFFVAVYACLFIYKMSRDLDAAQKHNALRQEYQKQMTLQPTPPKQSQGVHGLKLPHSSPSEPSEPSHYV